MTKIRLPYGQTSMDAVVPDGIEVQVVDPAGQTDAPPLEQSIEQALDAPIGTPRLEEMVTPQTHPVIIVNDHTRPGPNREMLAAVLARLARAGVPDANITILIATGSHRASKPDELERIVGADVMARLRIVCHDCRANNVHIDTTMAGMPVYIDRIAAEAEFIITNGVIVPHKTGGFSGGRKSIVPGVAGIETLRIHHSLPIRPMEPAMGHFEENPFHIQALEAARMLNVRFMLNVVQDPHKNNIAAVAGDLNEAHLRGVALCRALNTVRCDRRGDIVIASPGGTPRDSTLYQAQKALAVAEVFAAQTGCTFILVARAEDGIGPELFRQWLAEAKTPEEVVERFRREGFDVGTNKAFEYARALTKGNVIIVSENLDPATLKEMMLEHAPSLQAALDAALKARPEAKQILVLPRAVNIIPEFV